MIRVTYARDISLLRITETNDVQRRVVTQAKVPPQALCLTHGKNLETHCFARVCAFRMGIFFRPKEPFGTGPLVVPPGTFRNLTSGSSSRQVPPGTRETVPKRTD